MKIFHYVADQLKGVSLFECDIEETGESKVMIILQCQWLRQRTTINIYFIAIFGTIIGLEKIEKADIEWLKYVDDNISNQDKMPWYSGHQPRLLHRWLRFDSHSRRFTWQVNQTSPGSTNFVKGKDYLATNVIFLWVPFSYHC